MPTVNRMLAAYVFLYGSHSRRQYTENVDTARMLGDTDSLAYLDAPLGIRKAVGGHTASQGLVITELSSKRRYPKPIFGGSEHLTLHSSVEGTDSRAKIPVGSAKHDMNGSKFEGKVNVPPLTTGMAVGDEQN